TLSAKVIEALRAEDASGEEGVDHLDQRLLADVLPFAVTERFGRLVAVADPVAAGVIGVSLTRLAVHAQRVVPGGAMDDSTQLVEALLLAGSARAARAASLAHLGLDPFED